MEVIKSEAKKVVTATVELTDDECRALVEVLGKIDGKMSDRTYEIYDELDDIVNGE